jgi:hypothetical protein
MKTKFNNWMAKNDSATPFVKLTNAALFMVAENLNAANYFEVVSSRSESLSPSGGGSVGTKSKKKEGKIKDVEKSNMIKSIISKCLDLCLYYLDNRASGGPSIVEELGWVAAWEFELCPSFAKKLGKDPDYRLSYDYVKIISSISHHYSKSEASFSSRLHEFKRANGPSLAALSRDIAAFGNQQIKLHNEHQEPLFNELISKLSREISGVLSSSKDDDLRALAETCKVRIDAFGSSMSLLGLSSSDCDISISIIPQQNDISLSPTLKQINSLFINSENPHGKAIFEKMIDPQDPYILSADLPHHLAGSVKSEVLLGEIKDLFERASSEFKVKECIFSARIPILQVTHMGSGVDFDLCVGNPLAICNTSLIKSYIQNTGPAGTLFRYLALAVKYWAKRNACATANHGTLSSYAWVLLVINFLQSSSTTAISPTSGGKANDCKALPANWLPSLQCDQWVPLAPASGDLIFFDELGRLFVEFFEFYGIHHSERHFNPYQHISSIRMGTVLSKNLQKMSKQFKENSSKSSSGLEIKNNNANNNRNEDASDESDNDSDSNSENSDDESKISSLSHSDSITFNKSSFAIVNSKEAAPLRIASNENWRYCIEDPFEVHDLGSPIQRREGMNHILASMRGTLVKCLESKQPEGESLRDTVTHIKDSSIWRRVVGLDTPDPSRCLAEFELPALCRFCFGEGHRSKSCELLICSKCNLRGHFARLCPNPKASKQLFCYRCNTQSHSKKDCPFTKRGSKQSKQTEAKPILSSVLDGSSAVSVDLAAPKITSVESETTSDNCSYGIQSLKIKSSITESTDSKGLDLQTKATFKCRSCNKSFKTNFSLIQHEQSAMHKK